MSQDEKIREKIPTLKVRRRGIKVILGGEIYKMLTLKFHPCGRPMKGPTTMNKIICRRKRMHLHLLAHQLLIHP
jgi:hypothetical protein